ncbi:efflux RND transporter periplasmic adaptor subunit [Thiocapsa bogorovii]|uniref:efflux RND transporter periplasmic adaptor subunit n=1 Tax=Thiocapsa bogorovii TaxID=521689 RepID=UPI001E28722F|nr:efflux RND transporter periplasmic adaptor subunit [Thiocapsa bogorovii]UHD14242.1 efflux RND transporter periplasmic adaptor subunit [Thiocapsa bogorovii]
MTPTLCVLLALLAQGGTVSAASLIAVDADQQRAFGITLTTPLPAAETLTRRYPAEVTVPNRQMRVVAAPQSGVLESLLVAEGERVEVGQVLAELRSPELVDAQSQYLESLTRLELIESELARDRTLFGEGIIAERRLLESQSKQRELTTLVEQRLQLLELAGFSSEDIMTLARTRRLTSRLPVRAPIRGVVLEQMVSTGQSVATASPLYRVAELNPLWLEIHVPVERIVGLQEGGRVLLPREGTAGTVVTIGRMVHDQDQGVLVRAEISEGIERLRPGQFVEVQLSAEAEGESWRVPTEAVVRHAGNAYVFVSRGDGFEALPVRVLAEEEGSAVVAGDLTATDRIAVTGVVAVKAAWLGGAE